MLIDWLCLLIPPSRLRNKTKQFDGSDRFKPSLLSEQSNLGVASRTPITESSLEGSSEASVAVQDSSSLSVEPLETSTKDAGIVTEGSLGALPESGFGSELPVNLPTGVADLPLLNDRIPTQKPTTATTSPTATAATTTTANSSTEERIYDEIGLSNIDVNLRDSSTSKPRGTTHV